MATTSIKRYIGRFNSALQRKEWRWFGHPTVVVSGGSVSGALTEGLTASPNPAAVGATVTLTADTAGGTPPYTFTWTTPGPALTGSGNSRTFTAPTTATNLTFRVLATDSATPAATQEATTSVQVGASTSGVKLFAGHKPNSVMLGMAGPDDSSSVRPGITEGRTIIGQDVYELRRFNGNDYSTASFNGMINDAIAGEFPVISYKMPNWSNVPTGAYDSTLLNIYNDAVARRNAGKAPYALTFDHEPKGNAGGTLAEWAAAHTYCSYYFAGRRGGTAGSTYVSANDVSDIMSWCVISNGFFWRTNAYWTPTSSDANTSCPQSLVTALKNNKGILMADFYDVDYTDPTGAFTDESKRVASTSGVSTSKKIAQFLIWARAKNAGAVGCGEYGTITGAELDACWKVMRDNRDIWAVSNYFNSSNNSDHEWRLIPSTYPAYNGTFPNGWVDFGGDTNSDNRLTRFRVHLTESVSTTYTSPL